MRKLLFILISLVPSLAFAVVPEIPSDGIDNGTSSGTAGACPTGYVDAVYSTGCDLLLPDTYADRDRDGYAAVDDCDDTNRAIHDNVYVTTGCSAGEAKLCSGGSYGACASISTTCDATGSGVCKWVDCTSGSDAAAGTFAAPYKTLGKVSGGATNTPSSPWTPTAGSVVYIKGTCSTQFSGDGETKHLQVTASGDASNYITYRNWPGETPIISAASGNAIYGAVGKKYLNFYGLKISITNGYPIRILGDINSATDNIEYLNFADNWIYDSGGNGDNNFGGILLQHVNYATIQNNFFDNVTVLTGNELNTGSVVIIADHNSSTEVGHDIKVNHNVTFTDAYSDTDNTGCMFYKHGAEFDTAVYGRNEYIGNYCINPRLAWEQGGGDLIISGNLFYIDGSTPADLFYINADSPHAAHDNNTMIYNTAIGFGQGVWRLALFNGTEDLTFTKNVIVDTASSYASGGGILIMHQYGSGADKIVFEANSYLTADDNTYYNASAAVGFNYFTDSNSSFASWKTASSQDATSTEENPDFDTYFRPQAVNSTGRGYLANAASSGSSSSSSAAGAGGYLAGFLQ